MKDQLAGDNYSSAFSGGTITGDDSAIVAGIGNKISKITFEGATQEEIDKIMKSENDLLAEERKKRTAHQAEMINLEKLYEK